MAEPTVADQMRERAKVLRGRIVALVADEDRDEVVLAALRTELEGIEQDLTRAHSEAEFYERLDRMLGKATWGPGEVTRHKCRLCGVPYVYDSAMRLVHGGSGCKGSGAATAVAKPAEIKPPRRAESWYDREDD